MLRLFLFCALSFAFNDSLEINSTSSCDVYKKDSTNCDNNCGRCFNPGNKSFTPNWFHFAREDHFKDKMLNLQIRTG